MGGILENLRFQKTSESLTLQDVWSFRSSTNYKKSVNVATHTFSLENTQKKKNKFILLADCELQAGDVLYH